MGPNVDRLVMPLKERAYNLSPSDIVYAISSKYELIPLVIRWDLLDGADVRLIVWLQCRFDYHWASFLLLLCYCFLVFVIALSANLIIALSIDQLAYLFIDRSRYQLADVEACITLY